MIQVRKHWSEFPDKAYANSFDNKIWRSTVSELLLGPKTLLHIVYHVPCRWEGLRRQRTSEQIKWTVPSGIQTVFLRGAYWQPETVITVDVQFSRESCWVYAEYIETGRYFDAFVRSPHLNRAVILEHFHNLGNLPVSKLIDSVT